MPLLFPDYVELVLTAYEERGPNELPLLNHLTRANIKKECLNVYTERIAKGGKEEEYTLKLFFGIPSPGRNFGYMIRRCKADRFRSLQSFIRRETKNPHIANVELLAWLIDFTPRPLSQAQKLLDKINGRISSISPATGINEPEPLSGADSSSGTVIVVDENPEKVDEVIKDGGSTKIVKRRRHALKRTTAAFLISATTLSGAYFIIWPAGKSKPEEVKNTNGVVNDTSAIKLVEPPKKDSKKVIPIKMIKEITRCQAITQKKTQCKRAAKSNGYCWQHGK